MGIGFSSPPFGDFGSRADILFAFGHNPGLGGRDFF